MPRATLRDRNLIRRFAARGMTHVEIAKKVGLCAKTVGNILNTQPRKKSKPHRSFVAPEFAGIPQLSDAETDCSAAPTDRQERFLSGRVYAIAAQIKGEKIRRSLGRDSIT